MFNRLHNSMVMTKLYRWYLYNSLTINFNLFNGLLKMKRQCFYIPMVTMICMILSLWCYFMPTLPIETTNPKFESVMIIQSSGHNVSKQNVVSNQKNRYLIYLCASGRDCGGWGDRQRGMVSVFLLSLIWKRQFKIVLSTPCDIKTYYEPTQEFNWTFTEDELVGLKSKRKKTLAFISNDIPLMNLNMNSSEVADVLYIKTNCYSYSEISQKYTEYLPSYLQNKTRAGIFRESWNRFMIPKDRLVNQVMKIRSTGETNSDAKKSGKELVCAHIRIGRSAFFPYDYVGLPLARVPTVWSFIDKKFPQESRIFVATDHPDVRKSAISKYGKRYIGSYAYTMNPDKMRSNLTLACSSQESAYVDQLMLSKCDVLIYYKRSGFSLHASYLKTNWIHTYALRAHSIRKIFLDMK